MDMAEHELRKKHDDIVSSRIESLLDLAVRTSVAASDPFKEDLKVDIVPYDLITQLFRIINVRGHTLGPTEQVYPAFEPHASGLTGVEAFTLDYRVRYVSSYHHYWLLLTLFTLDSNFFHLILTSDFSFLFFFYM